MAKLTAEQRIEKCHVRLMRHQNYCLFSGLFMVGRVTVDDKVETAKTNGVDVTYGRAFVDRLNDKELAFLILHENMHKAYRHLIVWESLYRKNPQLANMACDYVINLQIRDYDPQCNETEMPKDEDGEVMGLIDEQFRGMDAYQVYLLLEKEQEQGGSGGSGDGRGQPQGGGNGKPQLDDHDWEGAKEQSAEEKEQTTREIEGALRQGALLAGKMKGNLSREMQDLLTPKVNWKEALRDFVKSSTQGKDQTTWRRLHKRYISMDIIMPSTYDEKVGSIMVAVDTSGSIGVAELSQFLSEVKSICEEVSPEKIELIYWDTAVAGHETYQSNELSNITQVTEAKGGGGTDPSCVPKYVTKNRLEPECVIMLTDGYIGSQKESDYQIGKPFMWCIKGNPNFNESVVGKVVHVE
jgi:predicted metal-dependent peptidase